MRRILAFVAGAWVLAFASQAHAQATRTWISGVGDDVNPCSRTAPCKTFAGAFSKTATGGEINALDPGGYGALTINKSITLDGGGTLASVLSTGTNGIVINAPGAVVMIRNLAFNGGNSTSGSGIRIIAAAEVTIENVTIFNYAGTGTNGRGIGIDTSSANTRVTIRNTRIINTGHFGIQSSPAPGGSVILDVHEVDISGGSATAIQLTSNTKAVIDRAVLTNHAVGAGVTLEQSGVTATISNSVLSNNAFGIFNGIGAPNVPVTRIAGNIITGNTSEGLAITSGQVISMGNNVIRDNAGNQTPTSTEPRT